MEPILGLLIDVFNASKGRVKNPHSLVKFRMLNELRKVYKSRDFIETGTYLGVTSGRAARKFDHVHTVEISPELHKRASQYLSRYPNVQTYCGDGTVVLQEILSHRELTRAIIFLDGHFSGGITSRGSVPEPAIEELRVIACTQEKVAAIMIDDFRSFGEEGYPKKSDLLLCVERLFPTFDIAVQFDQLIIFRRA